MRFFRSKVYTDYFEYLDKTGGFFYERWGDAPVHSFGLAMSLRKDQVVQLSDLGLVLTLSLTPPVLTFGVDGWSAISIKDGHMSALNSLDVPASKRVLQRVCHHPFISLYLKLILPC